MSKKGMMVLPAQMTLIEATKTAAFYLTPTGLVFKDKIPSQQIIERTYGGVKMAKKSSPWWIGDCIVAGEDYHGEESSQMFDPDEVAHETESNYANVSRAIPFPRRRGALSFSHHAVIYKLTPEDQETLLDWAIANQAGEKELRIEAAKYRTKKTGVVAHQRTLPGQKPETESIRIEFNPAHKSDVHHALNELKGNGTIEDWDACQ